MLNPSGKKYRTKCKAIPAWAVPHDACNGMGLRACGCTPLSDVDMQVLRGEPVKVA